MKTYRGHLTEPPTISVDDADGSRLLKPKNEDIGFAWGPPAAAAPGRFANMTSDDMDRIRQAEHKRAAGTNQTILAILTDLLGSEDAAVPVYQRVKHRTVLLWPSNQPWSITDAQLLKHLESIEQIDRETAHIRRAPFPRDVANEGGGGIVWDTDIEGRRRGPI